MTLDPLPSMSVDPAASTRIGAPSPHDTATLHPGQTIKSLPPADQTLATISLPTSTIAFGTVQKPGLTPSDDTVAFRILRVLGKGGMGVVYAAEQGSLRREVALKMVRPDAGARDVAETYFVSEAITTGRLDHPNIVSVHDLGRDADGNLFISMKLVRGLAWDRLLHPHDDEPKEAERARSMSRRDHIDILLRVCDAVAFAHAHDVVHRDLKPENVMVGEFGEILVMDWGLAFDVSETARVGRRGGGARGPMGTPRYMSPELATGDLDLIGKWTDIYLLGAILYEILTGTPPHRGDDVESVLFAAMEGKVEPVRERAPYRQIQPALDAIAMRALDPDPARRQGSVTDFAESIRAFLENEASLELAATATAEVERREREIAEVGMAPAEVYGGLNAAITEFRQALKLWDGNEAAREGIVRARFAYAAAALEREDLELALGELAMTPEDHPRRLALEKQVALARARRRRETRRRWLMLVLLAGLLIVAAALGVNESRHAAEERARADEARREATRNLARIFFEMGQASLAHAEARAAEVLFARAVTLDDGRETREALLRARTNSARLAWTSDEEAGTTAIAYSGDGAMLASGTADGATIVFAASTGKPLGRLDGSGSPLTAVAFQPGGTHLLAIAAEDGTVRLAEAPGLALLRQWKAHEGRAWGLAWSTDGKRIATAGEDRFVRLFDAATGAEIGASSLHEAAVYGVAFRPDGRELCSTSWDSTIRIWDAMTLAPLREIRQPVGWMFHPVYSPDGTRIIAGNDQTTVTLNDADTGALVLTLRGHDHAVEHLAASPDGAHVLTAGSGDRSVRVWNLVSAKPILAMSAREAETHGMGVAWSPDGRWLGLAGFDKRVSVWDLKGPREAQTLRGHERAAAGVRFSPDGTRVVSSAWDETLRIWDVASGRELRVIRAHEGQIEEVSWGKTGRYVASGGWDKAVRVFDAETGDRVAEFVGHEAWIPAVDLAPDDRYVASVSEDGTARIWDLATKQSRHVLTTASAVAKEGEAGAEGRALLCVAVSPDARQVAAGGADRLAHIWDAETGTEVMRLAGHEADIEGIAWSPDGKRIATGSWDKTVRIWDVATGRALQVLRGHEGWAYGVAFSPDGKRLCSASEDMTVRIWDLERGTEVVRLVGHFGEVQTSAWSPDGRWVASASYDATIRLWDLPAIERVLTMPAEALAAEAEQHTGLKVESLDPLALPGAPGVTV